MNYTKTQYGYKLIIVLLMAMLVILLSYYLQTDPKSIPFTPALLLILFLGLCIVFFYKLTITIDSKKITAIFGIGLLIKEVKLSDIELNSIEKTSFPWYVGVGIRLTNKGWLWNTKIGEAICFKTKNNKTFLVGTDDFETLKNTIIQLKKDYDEF